jgi:hypothetical protein
VCGLVAAVRRGVAPVGEEISVQLVVVSLVCRSLAFIGERVPLVLVGLTPVGQALAFVGGAVTQLGQAFAIGGVLPTPRTGSSPGLDGTFTLGGGRCPVLGLDSSGSGARFTLGVGPGDELAGKLGALYRPSPVPGDLLPDPPSRRRLLRQIR